MFKFKGQVRAWELAKKREKKEKREYQSDDGEEPELRKFRKPTEEVFQRKGGVSRIQSRRGVQQDKVGEENIAFSVNWEPLWIVVSLEHQG